MSIQEQPAWGKSKATEQLCCRLPQRLCVGPSRRDTNLKEGRVAWSRGLPRSEVPMERS